MSKGVIVLATVVYTRDVSCLVVVQQKLIYHRGNLYISLALEIFLPKKYFI